MQRGAARFARICIWSSTLAITMFASAVLGASPAERVDRQTKAALAMDAHPERGRKVFGRYCVKCHGPGALGNAKQGMPALAGQRYAYLVRQLANFANAERDNSTMHAVVSRSELQSPQVWTDIAAYLNGIPSRLPLTTGPGQDVALGRGIFHEQCAACHGSDASGDTDGFAPSLRHQHYAYLNAQMHKLAEGYRHNADEDLVRFLRGFDDRDMSATADYLSRLTGAGKDRKKMRDNGVVVD
jgi:cytochrome c553